MDSFSNSAAAEVIDGENVIDMKSLKSGGGGDGDSLPLIENKGRIRDLSMRFGEIAPQLPLFSVNETLVYFDHNRKRQMMTGRKFRSWVEKHVVVFGKFDSKTGAPVNESLTLGDSLDVLEAPDFLRGVREVKAVNEVRLPVLRKSGELELLPWGYDDEEQVYTVPKGIEYDMDWSVEQGREWVNKWFGSMPYQDDRSLAVMVSGLLCLYVRFLPGGNGLRPGFLWEANQPGSGKSVCAKACCSIVLGRAPVGSAKGKEEMDKEIAAHLKSKSPVIFLDNLYGKLKNATLDQLITSKLVTFREMGGQNIVEMENDAPVLLTGNDLEKNDDAWRRYLQCYLFEKGNPNDRVVEHFLSDELMREESWRKEALSSLWAFVRHWNALGRPEGPSTLGSFEPFSELMGGIVTSAGYEDPIARPDGDAGMSPERQDFVAMAKKMYEEMQEQESTKDKKLWGYEDMCRVARSIDVFSNIVGDEDMGKQETIKRDKIQMEHRQDAVDHGYMTQQQLQPFQQMLKSKIGTEPAFDGIKLKFGDQLKEKRKVKFTVEVLRNG